MSEFENTLQAHYSLQAALKSPPIMGLTDYDTPYDLGEPDYFDTGEQKQQKQSNCVEDTIPRSEVGSGNHQAHGLQLVENIDYGVGDKSYGLGALTSQKVTADPNDTTQPPMVVVHSQELLERIKGRVHMGIYYQIINLIGALGGHRITPGVLIKRVGELIRITHPDLYEEVVDFAMPGFVRTQKPTAKYQSSATGASQPEFEPEDTDQLTEWPTNFLVQSGTVESQEETSEFMPELMAGPQQTDTATSPASSLFAAPDRTLTFSTFADSFHSYVNHNLPNSVHPEQLALSSAPCSIIPVQSSVPKSTARLPQVGWFGPGKNPGYAGQPQHPPPFFGRRQCLDGVAATAPMVPLSEFHHHHQPSASASNHPANAATAKNTSISSSVHKGKALVPNSLPRTMTFLPPEVLPFDNRVRPIPLDIRFNAPNKIVHRKRKNSDLRGNTKTRRVSKIQSTDTAGIVARARRSPIPESEGSYVHAVCGLRFSSANEVFDHHFGHGRANKGCWNEHGQPNIAWNFHPSCSAGVSPIPTSGHGNRVNVKAKCAAKLPSLPQKRTRIGHPTKNTVKGISLAAHREEYEETSQEADESEEYEESEDAELSGENSSTEDEMLLPNIEIGDEEDVIKYSRTSLVSSEEDTENEAAEAEKHDDWVAELGMTKSELNALQFGTRTRSKRNAAK